MIERIDAPPANTRAEFDAENPYVGPRPYRQGERLYGRARESRDILGLLLSERLVLLYSPSGAGKTSLIEAAAVPCAEEEDVRVLPRIRFGLAGNADERLGGGNPLIATALTALSAPEHNAGAIPPAAAHTLKSYLDEERVRLGIERGDTPLLLIFDQFEEIFTEAVADAEALHSFFRELGSVLRDRRNYAIFSMREEHLAQLDRFHMYLPGKGLARYRIGFLEQRAAVDAVVGPARDRGVEFPESLGHRLVEDLSALSSDSSEATAEIRREHLVEPLHIQVACHAIWENLRVEWSAKHDREIRVVPEQAISAPGALDAMLADYYRRAIQSVVRDVQVSERVLRDWVGKRLITSKGLRDLVLRDASSTEIAAAADRLVSQLLVRREVRRGMVWYELSHDRFVRPILNDNQRWRHENGNFLIERTQRWLKNDRDDSELLAPDAVRDADRLLAAGAIELSDEERDYLNASRSRVTASKRKLRLFTHGLATAVIVVAVGGFTATRYVGSNWWQAAWLVLDLQKELQSRTYHEVPRQIVPLREVPIFPSDELIPRPSHSATFGAEEKSAMRSRARSLLEPELVRSRTADRSVYSVQLPASTPGELVNSLRQLGYRVSLSSRTEGIANSLIFADDVPMREVRVVALAHIAGGGDISRLRRYRTTGHSRDLSFEFDPDLMDWPGYTLADLDALKPLPYSNDEDPVPPRSE